MSKELPKYKRIKEEIKAGIHTGDWPVGAPVPSERELTITYGVTRNQTRQALRELELEGYIERAQGRRSVVAAREKRARPLIVGNKPTLAIAMQDQQTLHTQKILQGFMQSAGDAGFQTIAYNLLFDLAGEKRFIERIRGTGVAGLAFWPHFDQEPTRAALQHYQHSGFPVVLIDRYLAGLDMDAVVTDNVAVGALLTEALLARGHGRIAFVTEEDFSTSARERFAGCREAHHERNLAFEEGLYAVVAPDSGAVAEAVAHMQSRKERPTAYVCVHDRLAQAMGRELERLGYAIPGDIEIASLGDEHCARDAGPPMRILEQDSMSMGSKAFELLDARLRDPSRPTAVHRLAPHPENPIEAYPSGSDGEFPFNCDYRGQSGRLVPCTINQETKP